MDEKDGERERERDDTNKYVEITVIMTETKYWCTNKLDYAAGQAVDLYTTG